MGYSVDGVKLPDWAQAPSDDCCIRSFSDTDVVWESPDGKVHYQFKDELWDALAQPRSPWPKRAAVWTAAATFGGVLTIVVQHLVG